MTTRSFVGVPVAGRPSPNCPVDTLRRPASRASRRFCASAILSAFVTSGISHLFVSRRFADSPHDPRKKAASTGSLNKTDAIAFGERAAPDNLRCTHEHLDVPVIWHDGSALQPLVKFDNCADVQRHLPRSGNCKNVTHHYPFGSPRERMCTVPRLDFGELLGNRQ